jgi:hypothetical protein
VWTMILFALRVCARCSEVTIFCPLLEDVQTPTNPADWVFENGEWLPKFFYVAYLKWKHQGRKFRNKKYWMAIHYNRSNPRNCPVRWLRLHMQNVLAVTGRLTGPIFQDATGKPLSEGWFESRFVTLLEAVDYFGDQYSPAMRANMRTHTLRVVASQNGFARRICEIMATMRSADIKNVLHYLQQGQFRATNRSARVTPFLPWVSNPVPDAGQASLFAVAFQHAQRGGVSADALHTLQTLGGQPQSQ